MLQITGKVVNVFTQDGGKNKDGTEYAERHKVQLMGEMALPNGDVKMDLMDLTIDDLVDYKQLNTIHGFYMLNHLMLCKDLLHFQNYHVV